MDDIKGYVEKFATFGRPVEYNGLKLEPIVVGDSQRFDEIVGILQRRSYIHGLQSPRRSQ